MSIRTVWRGVSPIDGDTELPAQPLWAASCSIQPPTCSLQEGGLATFLPPSFPCLVPFILSAHVDLSYLSKPSSNSTFLWLLCIHSISFLKILIASITWHSFLFLLGFHILFGCLGWAVSKVPSSCRLPSPLSTYMSRLLKQVSTFSLKKIWGKAWEHTWGSALICMESTFLTGINMTKCSWEQMCSVILHSSNTQVFIFIFSK